MRPTRIPGILYSKQYSQLEEAYDDLEIQYIQLQEKIKELKSYTLDYPVKDNYLTRRMYHEALERYSDKLISIIKDL